MAFVLGAFRVAKYAGDKSDRSIQKRLCRNFTTCQNIIPHRDFYDAVVFQNPLINAFKAPAKQRYPLARRKAFGHSLGKGFAARAKINKGKGSLRALFCHFDGGADDIGAQHHASSAASGCIIDIAMLADPERPQVNCI